MKKLLVVLLTLAILIPMTFVSTSAATATVGDLIITEAQRNTKGNDYDEGFEIMNISNKPIDLYDYKVWYVTKDSAKELRNIVQEDLVNFTLLADAPGKVILQPGEMAFVWSIFSDLYNNGFVTQAADGTHVYDYQRLYDKVMNETAYDISKLKIIINNKTDMTFFSAGKVTNSPTGFNLANSGFFSLIITKLDGDLSKAVAIADVIENNAGFSHVYAPVAGTNVLELLDTLSFPSYGELVDDQKVKVDAFMKEYNAAASTTTTTAKVEVTTTAKAEVTTTAKVTATTKGIETAPITSDSVVIVGLVMLMSVVSALTITFSKKKSAR